jgi:hypothetical protein
LRHHAEIPIVTGNVVVRREGSFNVAIHRRLQTITLGAPMNRSSLPMNRSSLRGATDIVRRSSLGLRTSTDVLHRSTDVLHRSTDVLHRSTDVLHRSTDVLHRSTDVLHRSTDVLRLESKDDATSHTQMQATLAAIARTRLILHLVSQVLPTARSDRSIANERENCR